MTKPEPEPRLAAGTSPATAAAAAPSPAVPEPALASSPPASVRAAGPGAGALDPLAPLAPLAPTDTFVRRHLGPDAAEVAEMLASLGRGSLAELIDSTVPESIRLRRPLALAGLPGDRELGETEALMALRAMAEKNQLFRSFLGMGYYPCIVPGVVQRNILENPGWYTQYTPYQAEIAQGRLEALLNFQTMVADLTALPIANASLLDEATAAAEAMHMCHALAPAAARQGHAFLVSGDCHPQTIAVVRTRAEATGLEMRLGSHHDFDFSAGDVFGVLLQYPTTDGRVLDYEAVAERAHAAGALVVVAADLLALALLRPPGEFGADVAVGSSQRFGVPMGYGGPHAAFLATREQFKRQIPGRIIGVSRDAHGRTAYRMAMQTREQHIRREKATSNICTAQVLLAIMAAMYAVYHGPAGLAAIARRVHALAATLAAGLRRLGYDVGSEPFFDTLRVASPGLPGPLISTAPAVPTPLTSPTSPTPPNPSTPPTSARDRQPSTAQDVGAAVAAAAAARRVNLRRFEDGSLGVALDETATAAEVELLLEVFAAGRGAGVAAAAPAAPPAIAELAAAAGLPGLEPPAPHRRTSAYLTHPVFNRYHTEHEMLRYIKRLEARDLSLATSMIPLGSCTMKLNATVEMMPISWPELADMHPFAPREQTEGYQALFRTLESWLCEITGFAAASLQPNAGSQGELAGLLTIRAYHRAQARAGTRDVCLIPVSAHGTNPASAVMAGMKVVVVACDAAGNVDLGDLAAKADAHRDRLAAVMVTYPSTHGVFEEGIRELCAIVHAHGGQVYMDGANMNAQVGLCRPGDIGADVCHLNLHKTFCIPHGGGGPGMGPICVAQHLAPFLPGDPLAPLALLGAEPGGATDGDSRVGPVAAAPWGSAGILPIPWVYIALMGAQGLRRATEVAILNANYMAARLRPYYPVLYSGRHQRVAHEFILDLRPYKASAGIEAEDVAKRLMDYGFHAPTQSFPVAGTLMIEPTESESKAELDRFCDALIAIREEIRAVEEGRADRQDNALKRAPHTALEVTASSWERAYSREQAAFPAPWVREHKFWPAVGRVDNVWGDRNLMCSCPPVESYG